MQISYLKRPVVQIIFSLNYTIYKLSLIELFGKGKYFHCNITFGVWLSLKAFLQR